MKIQETVKKVEPDIQGQVDSERRKYRDKSMRFTGQVMTFIYRPHNGFADFAIVTMKLQDGKVIEVTEVSDPYLAIEAGARMEDKQARALEKMRSSYPGDHRHV